MNIIDYGFMTGALGILIGLICLYGLRSHRIAVDQRQAELGAQLQSVGINQETLNAQQAECSGRLAKLGDSVALLELNVGIPDEASKGGLTRSVRSQAMQLLRSGISTESAASRLGIGKREMHLIASVASTLTLK